MADNINNNKDLINITNQAGWRYLGEIIGQVFRLINGILLAHALGPMLLGLYQLGLRCQLFLFKISTLGLDMGLSRYMPIVLNQNKTGAKVLVSYTLRRGLIASIFLSILMFISSNYVAAEIFKKPDFTAVLKILSFLLPLLTINQLLVAANQGAKQIKYNVFFKQVLYSVLLFLVLITMYFSDVNFHVILISVVIIEGISTIFLIKSLEWTMDFSIDFRDITHSNRTELSIPSKELIGFSTPLLFHGLISYLSNSIDVFVLGYYCPSDAVGLYSVALNISILISFILYSFNEILMPVVSERFVTGDFQSIRYLYQSITKWIFFLSLMLVGLFYLLSKDMLLIFGEEYLSADVPLLILCLGQLINAAVGGVGLLLISIGRQRIVLLGSGIFFIINLILSYLFIGRMHLNMTGAALAQSVSMGLLNIFWLIQLRIVSGLHPYTVNYFKIIIVFIPAFLFSFSVLRLIEVWYVWRLLIGSLIFVSTILVLYFYYCISEEDVMVLNKVKEKLSWI